MTEQPPPRTARLWLFGLVAIAAIVAFFALPRMIGGSGVAPTPPMFAEGLTLAQAQARAAAESRVVLAVATADWCGPCQVYKRGALLDPRVEAWVREHAVPVLVDVDRDPDAAAALHVRAIPATILLRPAGGEAARAEGSVPPDALEAWLRESAR